MTSTHWTEASVELLEMVRAPRFGLLSDFDGTLCHFRPYPEMPHMSPRNEALIIELSRRLPVVALISGRAALELESVVKLPGIVYVGNHGLEELREGEVVVVPEAHEWEDRVTAFYRELGEPTLPGVRYQHKRITVSVSYRYVDNPAAVRLLLLDKLQRINARYGLHLSEGRTLWEVKPPISANKGSAVENLIREYELDAAVYLGDDYTDVPALARIRELRANRRIKGLAVAVLGETEVPPVRENADVLAEHVEDVEQFLQWILDHLPGSEDQEK